MAEIANEITFCNALDTDLLFVNMSKRGIESMDVLRGLNQKKPKKLYLQDNMIDRIENIYDFTTLVELNLSTNSIFIIENLDCLYNLSHLDLSNNCISKIENLDGLVHLKNLVLSNNNITNIERLDHLTELITLDLSRNEIRIMCNLGSLHKLEFLNLMGNLISTIPNLEKMDNLKWLNLSENRLHQVPVLDSKWGNLQHLFLSNNSIWSMNVTTCCLANNLISDWRELRHLQSLTKLSSICLKDNPYLKSNHEQFMYPLRIGRVLPNIITIDDINVSDDHQFVA